MRRLLLSALPLVSLATALSLVDIGMFTIGPGSAEEVFPRIQLDGVSVSEPRGRLLLTTVSIPRATVLHAAWAGWDPAVELVPEEAILGQRTEREHERLTRSQMDESKIAAVSIAATDLTDYPEEHGPGALVQNVLGGTAAAGKLFPGDLIVSVGDDPVDDVDDVSRAIVATEARRALALTVEAGGEERTVRIRPRMSEEEGRPIIGVILIEPFPFEVEIESGQIGGPSAGLMWTLGVYDLLSEEDLVDGRRIAGTGAIDLAGNVYAIGGAAQKVRAARDAGAEVFLVPRENLEEARAAGAGIRVVPVRDVRTALRFLRGTA
ncbi:MAG TPA: S16 family serine protease [Actinomycetota bacterium]